MTRAAKATPTRLIDYLTLASEHLQAKGIDGARLDAELLLCEALGLSRVELYTNHDRPLSAGEVDRFRELLRRRAAREPVAYITGRREFWSLELNVDRRVLIPRPETEVLVETALAVLRGELGQYGSRRRQASADTQAVADTRAETGADASANAHGSGGAQGAGSAQAAESAHGTQSAGFAQPADAATDATGKRVLEIGTGSGAIAVALAVEVPGLAVVATDSSASALEIAPDNARRHRVAERIEFVHGDAFEGLEDLGPFDLIVSNPPYCKQGEMAGLEPEIREWEPAGALVAGADGMAVTARIVEGAPALLAPDGWLLLEVGTQAEDTRALLARRGWRELRTVHDLAGLDRVVAARRPDA